MCISVHTWRGRGGREGRKEGESEMEGMRGGEVRKGKEGEREGNRKGSEEREGRKKRT